MCVIVTVIPVAHVNSLSLSVLLVDELCVCQCALLLGSAAPQWKHSIVPEWKQPQRKGNRGTNQ